MDNLIHGDNPYVLLLKGPVNSVSWEVGVQGVILWPSMPQDTIEPYPYYLVTGITSIEENMATRLDTIDSTRSKFYVMDDQELIGFCLDPPKMVEFNELKEAANELANRFHDLRNGY